MAVSKRAAKRRAQGDKSSAGRPIAGQVALVTGGSRGIGLAIARKLGDMGARVAICARSALELQQAESFLRNAGIEVLAREADVTRDEDIIALIHETRSRLGPVDILVNNAGVGRFAPFYEQTEADWDQIVDTNLKAVFLLSRAVAPQMIRRKTGHIINIGSMAGKSSFAGGGLYCASKWGLQGLSACMAEDLRAQGIRVSTICPGTVATDFSGPSSAAGRDPSTLLQPADVAHVVATLLMQSAASFISEVQLRPLRRS